MVMSSNVKEVCPRLDIWSAAAVKWGGERKDSGYAHRETAILCHAPVCNAVVEHDLCVSQLRIVLWFRLSACAKWEACVTHHCSVRSIAETQRYRSLLKAWQHWQDECYFLFIVAQLCIPEASDPSRNAYHGYDEEGSGRGKVEETRCASTA